MSSMILSSRSYVATSSKCTSSKTQLRHEAHLSLALETTSLPIFRHPSGHKSTTATTTTERLVCQPTRSMKHPLTKPSHLERSVKTIDGRGDLEFQRNQKQRKQNMKGKLPRYAFQDRVSNCTVVKMFDSSDLPSPFLEPKIMERRIAAAKVASASKT